MDSEFEFYSDDEYDRLPPIPSSIPIPTLFKPRMRDSVVLKKRSISGKEDVEMVKHLDELEKSILELAKTISKDDIAMQEEEKSAPEPSQTPAELLINDGDKKLNNASNLISEFVRTLEIEGFTIGSPNDSPSSHNVMVDITSSQVEIVDKPLKKRDIPPRTKSKANMLPPVPRLEEIKNYAEIVKNKVTSVDRDAPVSDKDSKAVDQDDKDAPIAVSLKEMSKKETQRPMKSALKKEKSKKTPTIKIIESDATTKKENLEPTLSQKEETGINDIPIDDTVERKTDLEKRSEKNSKDDNQKPRKRHARDKERKADPLLTSDEERMLVKKQPAEEPTKEKKSLTRKRSTRRNKKDVAPKRDDDIKDIDTSNDSGVEVVPTMESKKGEEITEATAPGQTTIPNSDPERETARVELLGKLKSRSPIERSKDEKAFPDVPDEVPADDSYDHEEGVVDLLDVYYPAKKHVVSMYIHDIFDVYDPAVPLPPTPLPKLPTLTKDASETATSAYTDSLILLYNPTVEDKKVQDKNFNPIPQRKKLPPRGKKPKTMKLKTLKTDPTKEKKIVPQSTTLKRKPSASRPDLDRLNLGTKERLR